MTEAPANVSAAVNWHAANQAQLVAALAELKVLLKVHAELGQGAVNGEQKVSHDAGFARPADQLAGRASPSGFREPATLLERPFSALDQICGSFGLSPFERRLLLLCAGIELDSSFAPLCAAAQGDASRNYPTFSLALAALPEPHWSALSPNGPLRRWRLLDLAPGPVVTVAPLRIDERVLHHLTGVSNLDERLAPLLEPIPVAGKTDLAPSQAAIIKRIVAAWSDALARRNPPVIELCAADPLDCRPIGAAVAEAFGLRAMALPAELIPGNAAELEALARLWEREAVLGRGLLLVDCGGESAAPNGLAKEANAVRFVSRVNGLVMTASREPLEIVRRTSLRWDVRRPSSNEQQTAWRAALETDASDTAPVAAALAGQFNLSCPDIQAFGAEALARATASPGQPLTDITWQVCRARCRTRLDGLAQRIESAARWEDLVLPEPQIQTLRQIVAQVRHRATVYETWGFAAKSARGLGISALFSGTSGTGKTMASEVLANELRLDLYRIDLASVVSKYIGETEKNLRRVFDAAENSGAILLFDEADAIFGKRSEVKDSHDRYANIEVSYLLQRMETYRGLAILTTNLKSSLDSAFLRRLRFIVQFPFPGPTERAEIWRHTFPKDTPTEGLDLPKLAKLNIAGGNIRNIAMNAAFLAADTAQPVRMSHALTAARAEYAKLERPLTDAEIMGWL